MTDPDRQARERANLVRHLNQSYPDTVLLVAVALAGVEGAEQAAVVALHEEGLVLRTQAAGAPAADVTVPLPGAPDEPLRQRVKALVERARRLNPEVPTTSMERMLDRHDSPPDRHGPP